MGLQEEFEECKGYVLKTKTVLDHMSGKDKLNLYGLGKQATFGPVDTSRPGILDIRERFKWDAWKAVEGKSKEEAMSEYVTKVKKALEKAGASPA